MTRTVLLSVLLAGLAGEASAKGTAKGPLIHMAMSGGRLGVQISSMTEELRGYFGAPTDAGVLVSRVETDSPAAKAGLKVGDVLVEVDGQKVEDVGDVISTLAGKAKGARSSLAIVRDKKRLTLSATLRDAPGNAFGNFDMNLDLPHGFRGFAFDSDSLEKLQKRLEELEKRLEKLERVQ